ncbi:MAG: Fic family protein [Solirubrobacteraceae bacterium]
MYGDCEPAGSTTFVHPDLVLGTLREGYRYVDSLPDGLARAVFLKFLIAEVHPFTDGNGRIARIFMTSIHLPGRSHRVSAASTPSPDVCC